MHLDQLNHLITRRRFLTRTSAGLGAAAVAGLCNSNMLAGATQSRGTGGVLDHPHFAPKAKRVIFLFMSGGPSHIDLFDHKPQLAEWHGKALPPSVRGDQRVTLMTRNQKRLLVFPSPYKFNNCGQSGQEISEQLPHLARVADELAIIRSMYSEPINHDPAITMMQTGAPLAGRPAMGSWLSYGLGSENRDLPDFVVLLSGSTGQPVLSRFWHNGFLPSNHQGVQFQSSGDPVLFLSNPQGINRATRGELIDGINELNRLKYEAVADPEIEARIDSFELAYRMQVSVPDLMDISKEPKQVHERYGTDPGAVSFANNCLLARRLAERGVRFIQLYHRGWDHHGRIAERLPALCKQTDQPVAALLEDLKQRGLLNETLVIWGGEFGRTTYCQGVLSEAAGRDHHPRCFSMWMAGGGIKGGITHGVTDEFGYNIVADGVHVHDFQATILRLLGIDHERLTFRHQGLDQRLTTIKGHVVKELLA